jgi:hypothetical protein
LTLLLSCGIIKSVVEKQHCSLKIRDSVGDWCSGSTADFDSAGTSSILVSPAKQNCIGLPNPVGWSHISCTAECGCVSYQETLSESRETLE